MYCKNCQTELNPAHKYCSQCGAKIINRRITIKSLISDLLISLGWDSQFFVTFRDLILRPQLVFEKYLNGTRKKHSNPFTFFAIGVALSVFVINFYSDELIKISTKTSLKPAETLIDGLPEDVNNTKSNDKAEYMLKQQSLNKKIVDFQFKYYYYLSFLLLPIYAFIAFLIFGKPNNYGEHLVINAYIQGLLFFFSLFLFFLALLTRIDFYTSGGIISMVIYYCYAYKKYRKYSIGQTLTKLLKFLAFIIIIMLLLVVIGYIFGRFIEK